MADASHAQSTFQSGEWSATKQGRVDDPRYKAALAKCLNYIPNVEGSLSPRSGFWMAGNTPRDKQADLIAFRISSHNAYVLEYTSDAFVIPSGCLRMWANGALVIKDRLAFTSVSVGGTPTFTMSGNFPAFWNQSAYPQSCLIHFDDVYGMEKAPHLVGRDFLLQLTGANTCTLADMSSGATITTPVTGTFTGSIYLAFQMVYKPTTLPFLPVVGGHRILEYSSQQLFNNGTTASVPDQRAVLFSVFTPPIVFSSAAGILNPRYAEFIDGPYFDSNGPNTPVSVSGTTGNITVGLLPYVATRKYKLNEIASDGAGNGYTNLVANQSGNALPAVVNANWALLPIAWNSATTYALGAAALGDPVNGGVSTVYYSQAAANINHALTDTSKWSPTPPTYAGGTTYAAGVVVRVPADVNYYVSIQAANIGNPPAASPAWWLPVDFTTTLTNTQDMFTITDASDTLLASDSGYPGINLHYENTGRLIRLKAGPAPWSNLVTYAINDLVNFNDIIYKAKTINTNKQPDTDAVNWEIQATTIQWTWGIIKTYTNPYTATVTLKGADLPNTNKIYEYRLGLYSSTTGWPTSGTYHEGRIALTCAAGGPNVIMGVPNRFDLGCPDQGFTFTPTAPDGTVSDGNGIAATLNSDKSEVIHSLKSSVDGILITTDIGEWIIAASNLNDPITPTSIQAKKATKFSSVASEIVSLPSAHAFIQNGSRRLIEFKSFMDVSAYQVRPNGSDLTRDCQHLTVNGIAAAAYQYIPQPVIWCLSGRLNETACNEQMNFYPHNLFGIGYTRGPDETHVAPFSCEHGWELLNGSIAIDSMAVQYGAAATKENLYISRGGVYGTIEYLEPILDTEGPSTDLTFIGTTNGYGALTDKQKILASGCFLDGAIAPVGVKVDATSAGVTYYGLWRYAGQTVSFVIMGKYIGDFTIASNGTVYIPFSTGVSTGVTPSGNFSMWDVAQAMVAQPIEHAYGYQEFVFDPNASAWGFYGDETVAGGYNVYKYCGYFGLKYRRRGKMLRPLIGSQNGPTFAKTVRNSRMGVYVDSAHEISVGASFDALVPAALTVDGPRDVTPLGIGTLTTGIYRDFVNDDYSFDGQLCWEQTEPYPGGILAVGGFDLVVDV